MTAIDDISPFFTNTDPYVDLTSHDAHTSGTPHATYARLRRESPVSWIDEADGSGFWAVVKYRDIVDVSRLFDTYTSRQGIRLEEMTPEETDSRRTLMEMDPPEHTRPRRLVSKVFTRRIVEEYEQQIRDLAIDVVDRAIADDEFDIVHRRRQAAADAHARRADGHARRRRRPPGRARRRAARQHRPRVHRSTWSTRSTPTSSA